MALYTCDDTEVKNLILALNPKKSSGPNSIPTQILQLLVNDICKCKGHQRDHHQIVMRSTTKPSNPTKQPASMWDQLHQ